MAKFKVRRSAVTGQFVTKEFAETHQDTTVTETVEGDDLRDSLKKVLEHLELRGHLSLYAGQQLWPLVGEEESE